MRARIGKIARLPGAIRNELNRRLYNGALGKELVPWLNAVPEVLHTLTERFASRPITEDNLSEWRRGGFQDWLRDQERRARIEELSSTVGQASCLSPSSSCHEPESITDRLDALMQQRLILELTEELERLSTLTDRTERFKRLVRLSRELCRVQRSRNRALEAGFFQAKTQSYSTPCHANARPIGASRAFSDKKHGGRGTTVVIILGTPPMKRIVSPSLIVSHRRELFTGSHCPSIYHE